MRSRLSEHLSTGQASREPTRPFESLRVLERKLAPLASHAHAHGTRTGRIDRRCRSVAHLARSTLFATWYEGEDSGPAAVAHRLGAPCPGRTSAGARRWRRGLGPRSSAGAGRARWSGAAWSAACGRPGGSGSGWGHLTPVLRRAACAMAPPVGARGRWRGRVTVGGAGPVPGPTGGADGDACLRRVTGGCRRARGPWPCSTRRRRFEPGSGVVGPVDGSADGLTSSPRRAERRQSWLGRWRGLMGPRRGRLNEPRRTCLLWCTAVYKKLP